MLFFPFFLHIACSYSGWYFVASAVCAVSFSETFEWLVFHWSQSGSNFSNVFRTLLSILADLNYAVVCTVSFTLLFLEQPCRKRKRMIEIWQEGARFPTASQRLADQVRKIIKKVEILQEINNQQDNNTVPDTSNINKQKHPNRNLVEIKKKSPNVYG